MVDGREEFYQVVAIDADAPIFVAPHPHQMPRKVIVDDGLQQISVELAQVALLFQLIAP